MNIRPTSLTFITTHQCTAACEHCCFACTPKKTNRLSFETMIAAINSAKKMGTFRVIGFSGGECFLLNELDDLVSHASRQKIRTQCFTNGYWATKPKAAKKRLESLANAGLEGLVFSAGHFHQQYVPAERVIHGANAAIELGIQVNISVEGAMNQSADVDVFMQNDTLRDHFRSGRLKLRKSSWLQTAGKPDINYLAKKDRFLDKNKSGCSTVLHNISITPDQSVVACCGFHMEQIPHMHLGSLKELSLDSVLAKAEDDLLKLWIHVEGPERIYEFAHKIDKSIERPKNCIHPCETCLALHQDQKLLKIIKQHSKQAEKEVIGKYMTSLAMDELTNRLQNLKEP